MMNKTHVSHRDRDTMLPEEKERATVAFLRSDMEALIGDWEHLGRGCT